MTGKVLYAELTPKEFRARLAAAPIAYLPLGTLEWHGEHLPLGADGIQSQGFFLRLAAQADGIVLPMLFVGPELVQMENLPTDRWPMAVSGKDPRIHASHEVREQAIARHLERMATLLQETLRCWPSLPSPLG